MSRERVRMTFTLSDRARVLLAGVGNYSQYVDQVIVQHGREWTDALAVLTAHGWHFPEMHAACEVLGGYGLTGTARGGAFLADELAASQSQIDVWSRLAVSPQRRARNLRQLREDPVVAYALSTLAREYWLPNEACRAVVQREA
jgi:hypothetical protein